VWEVTFVCPAGKRRTAHSTNSQSCVGAVVSVHDVVVLTRYIRGDGVHGVVTKSDTATQVRVREKALEPVASVINRIRVGECTWKELNQVPSKATEVSKLL
jgi:hypothetical protein